MPTRRPPSFRPATRRRALLLALLPITPSLASITSTGDVDPPVNAATDATVSGTLTVATTAAGSIDLSSTSTLAATTALLGHTPGGPAGDVTLHDSASFSLSNNLEIGEFGPGSLTLLDASQVSASYARVGTAAGSNGDLHLSGSSVLTTAGDFEVGSAGAGTLTADSSAAVVAGYGFVGLLSGSQGAATLYDNASLSTTYGFSVGGDGTGVLSVVSGTLAPGWLNIGERQSTPGGSGSVSLDGASSYLTTPGGVIAGLTTDGSLAASNGAHVSASFLELGRSSTGSASFSSGTAVSVNSVTLATDAGSSGTLSLQTGASLSAPDFLTLGYGGAASLTASSGAALSTGPVTVGSSPGSTGFATLTGASTAWTINPTPNSSSFLTLGYQGEGRLDLLDHASLSVGSLTVGWTNRGTLNVAGGAQLTASSNVTLAYDPGSAAVATISGAGSSLANSGFLEVAHSGSASLALSAGASMTNTSAILGVSAGSSATVTLDNASWSSSTFLTIGNDGAASLTAQNASTLSVTQGAIVALNHDASLTLDGPGTTFTTGATLEVGRDAHATLTVSNGAHLSASGFITLSSDTPGSAAALVTGNNSLIDSPSLLTVGNFGPATLTVQSGGRLHTASGGSALGSALNLAGQPGSTGSAIFTGAGTAVTLDGNLNVGFRGSGSLTISNGAAVTSQSGFLARLITTAAGGGSPSTASGSVTLAGPGSSWSLSDSLYVGGSDTSAAGPATLTLSNGAALNIANSLIVWPTGALNVSSATLHAANTTIAGTLTATALSLPTLTLTGSGSATLTPTAAPTPSLIGSLSIAPAATFDLSNDTLNLTSTPASTLRSYLLNHQLFSSLSDATHSLGYIPTPPGLLVQLALLGDANLDGRIDSDDYALLDRSLAVSRTSALWTDGDFNYDGVVTQNDYLLIDTAYLKAHGSFPGSLLTQRDAQFGPDYVSALLAAVPEPSLAFLPAAACPPLLVRTSRRTRKRRNSVVAH